ncbi:SMI1/KNR4 family protein [Actinoplanes sp. NPDC024001]|uniref:SMI1/KNR4 family protein n=1 Tax=Actinoplanes sp. NPDC024001 TaxID=3154598 RepID=UPI0033E398A1
MTARTGELWRGLEEWLRANAPRTFATLNPAADASTVAWLESQLGLELPAELVACLGRHNGADNTAVGPGFSFMGGFHLRDAAGIAADAAVCLTVLRRAPETRGRIWHEAWIPFATDFGGYFLVYDTRRRRPFGTVFYRDMVEGPWCASWDSMENLLADTLDALGQKRVSRATRLPRDYPFLGGWATERPTVHDGVLAWTPDRS